MKYARIPSGNIVVEVFTPPKGFELSDCFTPELVAEFVPCPEEVEANWIRQEDGTFLPPPVLLPSEKITDGGQE